MDDLRVVKCPKCGKDKWHRYGLKPGEPEPPCFDCLKVEEDTSAPCS